MSLYQTPHFADFRSLSQISLVIHYSPAWVSSARKVRTSRTLGEKENNSRSSSLFSSHHRRRRFLPWRLENRTKHQEKDSGIAKAQHRYPQRPFCTKDSYAATDARLGVEERTESNKNGEIRRKRRAHQTCNSDAPVVNYLAGGERDRGEADDDVDKARGTRSVAEASRRGKGNRARHGAVKRERVEGPRSSSLIKNSG